MPSTSGEFDGSLRSDPHLRSIRSFVDDQGNLVHLRRCAACRRWLGRTTEYFSPKKRVDGYVVTWDSSCRSCLSAYRRAAWATKTKDEQTAHHKKRWQLTKRSAEQLAVQRERNRQATARWREKNRELTRESNRRWRASLSRQRMRDLAERARMDHRLRAEQAGHEIVPAKPPITDHGHREDSGKFPSLPSLPVARAVRTLVMREKFSVVNPDAITTGISSHDGEVAPASWETICERLGTSAKTIHEWLVGARPAAQFDTVDLVLTRGYLNWWDVYDETTVRLPALAISHHVLAPASGRKRVPFKGKSECGERFEVERSRGWKLRRVGTDFVGDLGPDREMLTCVETAFTGEAEAAA